MPAHRKRKTSFIKDIYFTMFLLCRHLTFYEGEAEANAASLLVSFVGIALTFAICVWAELLVGLPLFRRWLLVPLGAAIPIINYVLFVEKDRGNKFGDKFSEYSERKQTVLYVVAVVAVIVILLGAGFSLIAYRHAHGIYT
jgi:hypothetical protein